MNRMESRDVDPRICRICESKKFLVNLLEEDNIHLLGKLREIQDVKKKTDVENIDELFHYICRSCENALEGFFVFKNRVQKMYRKLMHAALTGRINLSACDEEPEEITDTSYPSYKFDQKPKDFIAKPLDYEEDRDPLDVPISMESKIFDDIKRSGIIKTEPEFIIMDSKYTLDFVDDEDKDVTYEPDESSSSDEIDSTPLRKRKKLSPKKERGSNIPSLSSPGPKKKPQDKKTKTPEDEKSPITFKNCPICHRKFSVDQNLQSHIKLHSNLAFRCFSCRRVYNSLLNCEIHELSHKAGEPGVEERLKELRIRRSKALLLCLKNKEAAKKRARTFQVKNVSTKDTKKECKLCGKKYKFLNLHVKSHLQKNLSCIFCFEKFRSKGILRFHMRRNHPLLLMGRK
ncbi:zinc finger protein 583-like [Phlebotomus papatasi]|uniref:zinc finger protein 583-like n=1 Tax=Phlebotomus papatasi TaxID=29031 RepID=UPI0024843EBE|nr:zinc finger protein 583-like [Phlebotomus papatasi]